MPDHWIMKLLGLAAGILVVFLLRFALNNQFKKVAAATSGGPATCLVMLGSTTREEAGATYITGSIRNDCARRVSNVTIAFKPEQSTDQKTGFPNAPAFASRAPVFAYTRDVDPGETRNFKSEFPVARNSLYQFDGMTAF
jgi:hypothetical protein